MEGSQMGRDQSSPGEEAQPSTSDQTSKDRPNASNRLLIEAEQFKASVARPKGKSHEAAFGAVDGTQSVLVQNKPR